MRNWNLRAAAVVLMTLIRVWERRSLGAPCLVDKKEQFGGFFTLTRCTLSDVPDFIPPDTRHVTLHWNKLTRIPPGVFSHLSSCTKLEVAYNRLNRIQTESFRGLSAVTEMSLGYNNISQIEAGAFSPLSSCATLWLGYNKLTHIQAGVFEGLESLEILSLGDNLIQYIHPEALTSLGNLQQLFLDNNRLVTLETDSLPVPAGSRGAEWSRVMSMTLGLNPLRCDGGLCWLWEAERAGNFRLYFEDFSDPLHKPDCAGIDWDDAMLYCDNLTHGDFPVQKKETPLPPVGKSADSADYTVYYIIGGVSAAVVIIVITACTALIVRRQRRRRDLRVKHLKKAEANPAYGLGGGGGGGAGVAGRHEGAGRGGGGGGGGGLPVMHRMRRTLLPQLIPRQPDPNHNLGRDLEHEQEHDLERIPDHNLVYNLGHYQGRNPDRQVSETSEKIYSEINEVPMTEGIMTTAL